MSSVQTPATRWLATIGERIDQIRRDVPQLTQLGEMMAGHLLAGGALFTPQIGTYWPSEFGSRAGGLMGLKPSTYVAESEHDVAFTTLPDPRGRAAADDAAFGRLLESKAQIVVIGSPEELRSSSTGRIAGFTGGAAASEGFFARDGIDPLSPLRPFDQLVRGWLTAGEMIAACTRGDRGGGRMPIIWMSVWLEGAMPRNAAFFKHDNLREPWYPPLFHESIYIPPMAPGYTSAAFLSELQSLHATLSSQTERLARAGEWMAEAIRGGQRVSTVMVGHSYPEILEIKDLRAYPLSWLPSISDLQKAHPDDLSSGDVALHLGYSPVNVPDVKRLLDRGIRFIYSSPYGRPEQLKDHENLLWLDLPWRPGDATVDVVGYSVRIMPMSSSAHTMAYFAMMCELAERMGWE